MHCHSIDVVLDVGANDGDYGREIRDRGYKGLIVSFEPNPDVYQRLVRSTSGDANWLTYPYGLGSQDGTASLRIAENDTMSSFNELTEFGLCTGAKLTKTEHVKILTIDTFLREHPELDRRIYLKIDTQGFEMEVLKGAVGHLDRITAVQAELALVHSYRNESDWLDVILWMRSNNFEVATAVCNSALVAQVREFDFVFVNQRASAFSLHRS